ASLPPLSFVPFVVPDILKLRAGGADPFSDGEPQEVPTAIWGDAAVWVAEALWNAYGDLDRLRAEYPGMCSTSRPWSERCPPAACGPRASSAGTGSPPTPRHTTPGPRRPTRAWSPPPA